ncbi:PrsW family glutamic-type intramembrane protease [Treponema lecithinolyticum]|uniref:PrsW family glutamic-type intramembrane protease n=1 Tax=Treponema lecithinolyticum TaxID=53418 RepID=UPI0028E60D6F|nr:PrsW family glutamic-type intramembrane protease [Treponema lecithinolyticum]
MKMYITLALCFAPLIVEIVFSLIKISSFRLSQAGWAVAAGFAAIVPIIIVQYILQQTDWFSVSSMPSLLAEALIFNGLIEEAVKMLFLFFLPAKKIKLPVFIACAVIAGGTVGSFEAVMYFVAGTHYSALRLCTAAVLHALCAGLSGVFVWTAKNKTRKRKAQFAAFCAAVFCHGIYNFFAGFNGFLWWFSLAALLFALIQLRSFYTES